MSEQTSGHHDDSYQPHRSESHTEKHQEPTVQPSAPGGNYPDAVQQGARLEVQQPPAAKVRPHTPLKWLYGVRIAIFVILLVVDVVSTVGFLIFILAQGFNGYGPKGSNGYDPSTETYLQWAMPSFLISAVYTAYLVAQIIAAILYLRNRALVYIIVVNIIGALWGLYGTARLVYQIISGTAFFTEQDPQMLLAFTADKIDMVLCFLFATLAIMTFKKTPYPATSVHGKHPDVNVASQAARKPL